MPLHERIRRYGAPFGARLARHDIKHAGFHILARRDAAGVGLITRAGNDFSGRFAFIARPLFATKTGLRSMSKLGSPRWIRSKHRTLATRGVSG
jgi:hypothetical protein